MRCFLQYFISVQILFLTIYVIIYFNSFLFRGLDPAIVKNEAMYYGIAPIGMYLICKFLYCKVSLVPKHILAVAQWYNPMTLLPEQSDGQDLISSRAQALERHDLGLLYFCNPNAAEAENHSFTSPLYSAFLLSRLYRPTLRDFYLKLRRCI